MGARAERAVRACGLAGLLCCGAVGARALEAPTAPAPFGWLGELAGACWLGTDAAGRPTDRQCYSRQYAFLRGSIEIFAGSATGKAAYTGDSLFAWDESKGTIEYDYWASAGHFGRGTAHFEGDRLVFPPTDEGEAGKPRTRSIWQRLEADSFRVVRERSEGDGWGETLRVDYRRDAAGAPPSLRSEAPAAGGPLAGFAFLADSCWTGTFANGVTRDENCFEWTLGGRFLRSRHVVKQGEGPYEGETLYGFDAQRGTAFFVYWNSQGGVIRGDATPTANGVDFPSETVEMGGKRFELRTSWTRDGDTRFVALTERRQDEAWQPMMRIEFVRDAPGPPAP